MHNTYYTAQQFEEALTKAEQLARELAKQKGQLAAAKTEHNTAKVTLARMKADRFLSLEQGTVKQKEMEVDLMTVPQQDRVTVTANLCYELETKVGLTRRLYNLAYAMVNSMTDFKEDK
jgi:hypothetical protein